jgi:hypothetical protein
VSIGEEEETGRTRSHVTLRVLPTYYWVAKFDLATDRPSTSSILLAFTTAHDCGYASSESLLIWSSLETTASTVIQHPYFDYCNREFTTNGAITFGSKTERRQKVFLLRRHYHCSLLRDKRYPVILLVHTDRMELGSLDIHGMSH